MSERTMKTAIKHMIAVSTAFLLGGLPIGAGAQGCAPAVVNPNLAIAETLVQQNESRQAYAYLNVARDEGSAEAFRFTGEMFAKGRGVEANPVMARHMFWMGAQSNDPESMFRTASDLYQRGLKKDAEIWALKAKECGHLGALMLLVKQFAQERRYAEARDLLSQAIDAGFTPAKLFLAEVFDKGQLGFQKDLQAAFKWYYLAAKDGEPEAMTGVAYYFARGIHGVQDDVAAIHWYHQAAKKGHVESMTAYAWMLAKGKGAQANVDEATFYLRKASRLGDINAKTFLVEIGKCGSGLSFEKPLVVKSKY